MSVASPETELWRAVIRQAVVDATSPLSRDRKERLEQIRARDWITNSGRTFKQACSLANLDPEYVRKRALPLIAKAELEPPRPASQQQGAKRYEYQGRSLTIAEWAEATGISDAMIRQRLKLGWSVEAALTAPKHQRRRNITPQDQAESIECHVPV